MAQVDIASHVSTPEQYHQRIKDLEQEVVEYQELGLVEVVHIFQGMIMGLKQVAPLIESLSTKTGPDDGDDI